MNRFLFCVLLNFSIGSYANSLKEPSSLLLESIDFDDTGMVLKEISEKEPSLICVISQDGEALQKFYQTHLEPFYTKVYTWHSLNNLWIFSRCELDHFSVQKFDEKNFILEIASQHQSHTTFWGHLPDLYPNQIETLKSYLIATNPYLLKTLSGDLSFTNPYEKSLLKLCVKGGVEVSAESDTKGNKSVKGLGEIRSNDNKSLGLAEIEFKENEKGEKEARAKVTYKKEF
jgi:hypothetical protein